MNINPVPAIGVCDADNNRANGLKFPHCDTVVAFLCMAFRRNPLILLLLFSKKLRVSEV
jgi:hypothetical protein